MDGVNTANALYRGWHDVEVVRGNRDDAISGSIPSSSRFTAINHSPSRLLTPQSSAVPPVQQIEARRRATRKRRHNPAVAEYLGLGSSDEPTHLEKYAPLPAGYTPPVAPLKRRKLATGDKKSDYIRGSTNGETDLIQQLVSQSFRIAKPVRRPTANKSQLYAADQTTSVFPRAAYSQTRQQGTPGQSSLQSHSRGYIHRPFREDREAVPMREFSEETIAASKSQNTVDFSHCDDHGPSAQLDPYGWQQNEVETFHDDEEFDCGIVDDDLLSLVPTTSFTLFDDSIRPPKATAGDENGMGKQAKSALRGSTPVVSEQSTGPNRSQHPSSRFKSPLTQTSRLLAATGDVENPDARKPLARPPFPTAVRDRSPIIGLSSNTLLRTCFRIGEVINQSSQALKTGKAVISELYARVLESERTDMQQSFTFCDLFHAKPPYIKGNYHATIWKSVQLFEYDGRRLLQTGRICRCIGMMKRVEKQWVMTVLNIWEATWEDIKWVEGIVGF